MCAKQNPPRSGTSTPPPADMRAQHWAPHLPPSPRAQLFDVVDAEMQTILHSLGLAGSTIASNQSLARSTRGTPPNDIAAEELKFFVESVDPKNKRLVAMASNVSSFIETSKGLMPSSWIKTGVRVKGLVPLDLAVPETLREVNVLCRRKRLVPPADFVKVRLAIIARECRHLWAA